MFLARALAALVPCGDVVLFLLRRRRSLPAPWCPPLALLLLLLPELRRARQQALTPQRPHARLSPGAATAPQKGRRLGCCRGGGGLGRRQRRWSLLQLLLLLLPRVHQIRLSCAQHHLAAVGKAKGARARVQGERPSVAVCERDAAGAGGCCWSCWNWPSDQLGGQPRREAGKVGGDGGRDDGPVCGFVEGVEGGGVRARSTVAAAQLGGARQPRWISASHQILRSCAYLTGRERCTRTRSLSGPSCGGSIAREGASRVTPPLGARDETKSRAPAAAVPGVRARTNEGKRVMSSRETEQVIILCLGCV